MLRPTKLARSWAHGRDQSTREPWPKLDLVVPRFRAWLTRRDPDQADTEGASDLIGAQVNPWRAPGRRPYVRTSVDPETPGPFRPMEGLYAFRFDTDGDQYQDGTFKVRFGDVSLRDHDGRPGQSLTVHCGTGHHARATGLTVSSWQKGQPARSSRRAILRRDCAGSVRRRRSCARRVSRDR